MADEAKARGNAAFSAGNFAQAISHFTEAINLSPTTHIFYSNRSAAHASLSNFTQALTDAEKTVELKPDWPKGYSRLAAAYTGLHNYKHAASSFEKGLEIDPDNDFLKSGLADATSLSKKQVELKEEFKSAETSGEMLKLFKEMEGLFDENELGMECWAIARELLSDCLPLRRKGLTDGVILEKVVSFCKRALKALVDDSKYTDLPCIKSVLSNISIVEIINGDVDHHGVSLFVASTHAFLGAACVDLGRFEEGTSYLEWAYRSLTKLEGDNRCAGNCVLHVLDVTHHELFRVKEQTNRKEEGAHHLRKRVEFREMVLEEGCFEIGVACKDACAGYLAALDSKQAKPFCLKALEIYTKHVGTDNVDVAGLRRNLAIIYTDLREHEKAIEQNQIALGILKELTPDSPDLLELEIENAHMMLASGRCQEVIKILNGVVSRDDISAKYQAFAYVNMAKASCKLRYFADAKNYMRIVEGIIDSDKIGMLARFVAVLFGDMADQCRYYMNDLETAMSFTKKALSIPKLSERVLAECSSGFFLLVSLSGKEKEELSYMKDVVEMLKSKFGPVHREVGYGYINLGTAYLKSAQPKSAVKFMGMAKEIVDATVCSVPKSNLRVINILEKAINSYEVKQEFLDVAVEILNNLKAQSIK